MPRLRREKAKGLKNGTDYRFPFWQWFSSLQKRAKCRWGEPRLTFLYLVIILAASGKRSVHKGVIRPNFCILRGILMCVPFFGLPSTWLHVFDGKDIRSSAGYSPANCLFSNGFFRYFEISIFSLACRWNEKCSRIVQGILIPYIA